MSRISEKYKDTTEIARWPASKNELFLVTIFRVGSQQKVDFRRWFVDLQGCLHPSRAGIRFPLEELPRLRRALKKTVRRLEGRR